MASPKQSAKPTLERVGSPASPSGDAVSPSSSLDMQVRSEYMNWISELRTRTFPEKFVLRLPKDFVFPLAILDKFLEAFELLYAVRTHEKAYAAYETLRIHFLKFSDVNPVLAAYWSHPLCQNGDDGPLGIVHLDIKPDLFEVQRSIGLKSRKDISNSARALAWLLLCDFQGSLVHLLKHIETSMDVASTTNGNGLLPSFIEILKQLPILSEFQSNKPGIGGSLFFPVFRFIAGELADQKASFKNLVNMIVDFADKNANFFTGNTLLAECINQLVIDCNSEFWMEVLAALFKRRSAAITWTSKESSVNNPEYLLAFLLCRYGADLAAGRRLSVGKFRKFMTALGKRFDDANAKLSNSQILRSVVSLPWTVKWAAIVSLQDQFRGVDGYRIEVPAAMFSVLIPAEQKRYAKILDHADTLENYLTSVFEAHFIVGTVPMEFLANVQDVYDTVSGFDVVAKAFYQAYANSSTIADVAITDSTMRLIVFILKALDCELLGPPGPVATPSSLEIFLQAQGIGLLSRAFLVAVVLTNTHVRHVDPASRIKASDLPPIALDILTEFCVRTVGRAKVAIVAIQRGLIYNKTLLVVKEIGLLYEFFIPIRRILLDPVPDDMILTNQTLKAATSALQTVLPV